MPTVQRQSGVVVEAAAGVAVVDRPRPGRRRQGAPAPPSGAALEDVVHAARRQAALADAFDLAAPAGRARGGAAVRLRVPLRPGQRALLLREEDGVFTWHLPLAGGRPARRRTARPDEAVFALPGPGAAPARRAAVAVLTFPLSAIIDLAVARSERGRRSGLVQIAGADLAAWQRVAAAKVRLRPGADPRVLVLLHGANSSTAGGFGALTATAAGRAFLRDAVAHYDAVLGFDHPTLSLDPRQNAEALLRSLRRVPCAGALRLDVVAHSRGGLVARALAEALLPAAGAAPRLERCVLVAAPNAGTELARPANWERLAGIATTLAAASARALSLAEPGSAAAAKALEAAVTGAMALLKLVVAKGLEEAEIPGLAAMVPGGPFLRSLGWPPGAASGAAALPLFAVVSNFEPALREPDRELGSRLLRALGDGMADGFFGAANDLVVGVASMRALPPGARFREVLDYGANGRVYHTNYFARAETALALRGWLEVPAGPAPAIARTAAATPPPGPGDGALLHVVAETSATIARGRPATVTVTLAREGLAGRGSATGAGVRRAAAPAHRLVVMLQAKKNATVAGEGRVECDLPAPGRPTELSFEARATAPGEVELRLVVRQSAEPLVALRLAPRVAARGRARQRPLRAEAAAPLPPWPPFDCPQLYVTEQVNGGRVNFHYSLELGRGGNRLAIFGESPPLAMPPAQYVAALLADLDSPAAASKEERAVFDEKLRFKGVTLFKQLFPLHLQEELWRRRDQIGMIQLVADEPSIPWEVVHLCKPGRPAGRASRFLGQMGLTRWLAGDAAMLVAPPRSLRLRPGRARVLAPAYAPGSGWELPAARAEGEWLRDNLGARLETASSWRRLVGLLRTPGQFDLWHFAGHGQAAAGNAADQELVLGVREAHGRWQAGPVLRAHEVAAGARLAEEAAGDRPVVVLNACGAGAAGYALTGLGGFASAFLQAGAGAFVGPLWSVGDDVARAFIQSFYAGLLAGEPVARATAAARRAARESGDPAWLAYAVYAHPGARVATER